MRAKIFVDLLPGFILYTVAPFTPSGIMTVFGSLVVACVVRLLTLGTHVVSAVSSRPVDRELLCWLHFIARTASLTSHVCDDIATSSDQSPDTPDLTPKWEILRPLSVLGFLAVPESPTAESNRDYQ